MKKIIYLIFVLWISTQSVFAKKDESFYFQFNNEELVDIIHRLAGRKGVNIVFPVKAPITCNVTMFLEEPFTTDQAWEKLYTLLDLAGYSLINKDANGKEIDKNINTKDSRYTIVKTEKDITKEALPIYIGIPPHQLPDSDERIRYLYYMTNLKVGESDKFASSELGIVLKEMLPDTASFQADSITNGVLITDKANNIKAVMDIITRLDSATEQENFEVIPLLNTDATTIAALFSDILKTNDTARSRFEAKKQLSEASYFPKNIRIVPLTRTNSLLVLGTHAAIERIRDFLTKYIDVEIESGKSILHIYKLQYMDAEKIAEVLTNILVSKKESTGQTKSDKGETVINPATQERLFDEIIIRTDKTTQTGDNAKYFGNNNLIIAARNDDWQRIKPLIEKLDKPQTQVIIEVLIANLTVQDTRALGSISRNPLELGFPPGVNIQSAQIGSGAVVLPVTSAGVAQLNPPTTLAGDLMGNGFFGNPLQPQTTGVAGTLPAGSTVVAFNDANTGSSWAVLQLLDAFTYSKVISHPHLIATSGAEASVSIGVKQLLTDQTTGSGGGTAAIQNKDVEAKLTVTLTPRIYTSGAPGGKGDSVSLKINVNIDNFIPSNGTSTQPARLTRLFETHAMLNNGQILALGGLIQHVITDGVSESPIWGKIPILGWLGKGRTSEKEDDNLTVFIAPTIIEPRLHGGTGSYTTDYADQARQYSKSGELFDTLRDPITRWFFKKEYDPQKDISDFLAQDEFKKQPNKIQYKTLVDTEQALSGEEIALDEQNQHEPNTPASKGDPKEVKRIVLGNVKNNNADSANESCDSENTEISDDRAPICTASSAPNTPPINEDPLLALLNDQPDSIQPADNEASKKLHITSLRERLQDILMSEDNPLL